MRKVYNLINYPDTILNMKSENIIVNIPDINIPKSCVIQKINKDVKDIRINKI